MLHGHADMQQHIIKRPTKLNKLSEKEAEQLDQDVQKILRGIQDVKR